MADDEDEKRKKARVKIERDAYPTLLAFKNGATALQVEESILQLLGISYANKYHAAGVANMHQILLEHPQIRQRHDGKFQILANEDNIELVALVAKQKDKGSGRAKSCMPYSSKNTIRTFSRFSPKQSRMKRPGTATGRKLTQKVGSTSFQASPPNYRQSFNKSFTSASFRSNASPYRSRAKVNKLEPLPVQRPLVRPKTSSSICSSSRDSQPNNSPISRKNPTIEVTDSKAEPLPAQQCDQMPSIKQFSDNVKRMMMKISPGSIPLSDMTARYFCEYKVMIDPSQLFSKSWAMLAKTTFKAWLEINGINVSLKDNVPTEQFSNTLMTNRKKTQVNCQIDDYPKNGKLNVRGTEQFSFDTPSISPSDMVVEQMKELTIGYRQPRRTPEKPPGTNFGAAHHGFNLMKHVTGSNQRSPVSSNTKSHGPFIQTNDSGNCHYEKSKLLQIKTETIDENIKNYVEAALNGVHFLKRRKFEAPRSCRRTTTSAGYCRVSPTGRNSRQFFYNKEANASRNFYNLNSDTTIDSEASNSLQSSLSPPDSKPTRMRLVEPVKITTKCDKIETFNSVEIVPIRMVPKEQDFNTTFQKANVANKKDAVSSCSSEKIQSRRLVLPPMSKGLVSKYHARLPFSCTIQTATSSSDSSMSGARPPDFRSRIAEDDLW